MNNFANRSQIRNFVELDIALTREEREEAFELRHEVFINELGRDRVVETDALDRDAVHVIARDRATGYVVGTLRLYSDERYPESRKIGRVAVSPAYRGRGLGQELIYYAHAQAEMIVGVNYVVLHAECSQRGFYERLGYQVEGDVFREAGADHIIMYAQLNLAEGGKFSG